MNIEQLQLIKRTPTANTVLKFFSNRERISNDTSLESFRAFLTRNGYTIDKGEFEQLFRELEGAGAGKLVEYNGKPAGKFIWSYSLRDVSDQILNPNKLVAFGDKQSIEPMIVPLAPKKRAGRPKGIPKPKVTLVEVIFPFYTEDEELIVFKLRDAERLVAQVQSIKAKLG